jgi:2,5-furandicarboxylate decarboxylase 1
VSFREKGFYHGIVPWGVEVDNLLYLIHGLDFIPKMRKEIPWIKKIHIVPRTFGSNIVMSIEAAEKSDVRRALVTALALTNTKKVTVVDEDVDVEDNAEVEWAIATRFQADRDLIVIPGLRGQPIDPSSGEGFATAKIGIDATKPRKQGFEKVGIPAEVSQKITPILNGLVRKDFK